MNKRLNASEVTGRAWELAKKHGLILAVVLFAVSMITSSLSFMGFPWSDYIEAIAENDTEAALELAEGMGSMSLLSIVGGLVSLVIMAGLTNIAIKVVKGEMKNFDLAGFKMPAMTYVNFVVATILMGIAIGLGTVMCIVPGIFLAVRLALVTICVLEHPEEGIGGAFSRSWKMTKGNFWSIFVLGIYYILIAFLGLLCCCVGVYFAYAMGILMLIVAYFTLSDDTATTETVAIEDIHTDKQNI